MKTKYLLVAVIAVLVVSARTSLALPQYLGRSESHFLQPKTTPTVANQRQLFAVKAPAPKITVAQPVRGKAVRHMSFGPWTQPFIKDATKLTRYGHGPSIKKGKKVVKLGGEDRWSKRNQSSTGLTLREPTLNTAGVAAASIHGIELPYGSLIVPMIEDGKYAYVNADSGMAVTAQKALRTIHSTTVKKFVKNGKTVVRRVKRTFLRSLRKGDATVDICRNSHQFWSDRPIPVVFVPYNGPPFAKLPLAEKEALMRQAPKVARTILAMNGFNNRFASSESVVHNRSH
jgi:hypothetical protein